jgi:hypothetical protein
MQGNDKDSPTLSIRTCGSCYPVFTILLGSPLALFFIVGMHKEKMFGLPIAFCLLAMALFYLWLGYHKLELLNNSITYRTLLCGTSSLGFSEMDKMGVQMGCSKYSDRFRPTMRLVIELKPSTNKPHLVVNLKVFSKKDLIRLDHYLNSKLRV